MYCTYWYVLLYLLVLVSLHNTYQILAQYIPIHTRIHANTCMLGENLCAEPMQYWHVSCMYRGIYWYVLACIWYVMACIEFQFSTLIFAQHTSIGMYPGMYRYGLSKYWACIQTQYVS